MTPTHKFPLHQLSVLPDRLLTPHLQDLALNHNRLGAVPSRVGGLTRLRTLDLGENAIETLPPRLLANLTGLYGLRLAGNRLTGLAADTFANNTNLHVLNLAHNRLARVDQERKFMSFSHCQKLGQLADLIGCSFSQ